MVAFTNIGTFIFRDGHVFINCIIDCDSLKGLLLDIEVGNFIRNLYSITISGIGVGLSALVCV